MADDKYEYGNPKELDGEESLYFSVPASIIFDDDMGVRRVTVFSFFSEFRGLTSKMFFSVNDIVKWSGKKPNRNKGKINDQILDVVDRLDDNGFVSLSGKPNGSSTAMATFDVDKIARMCLNESGYAVIYFDELHKILSYENPNSKDSYLNCDVVLLVFSYLRMRIFRRRNRIRHGEFVVDEFNRIMIDETIEKRRVDSPEAYSEYYCIIAEELGLSEKSVSKAVDVLAELGLICFETLPRKKVDGKWTTQPTVFCNAYKREKSSLLDCGDDYCKREITNKKRKMKIM